MSADVLRPFATASGAICVLALDHRDALRNTYRRAGLDEPTEQTMLELKRTVIDTVGRRASALLLDAPAVRGFGAPPLPIFMPLEAQGHDVVDGGRQNRLLDDFGPQQARELGARGCKLLLYYRDDHVATARAQLALAERAAAQCHEHGLALVVEPKVYRLGHEDADDYARSFHDHVVAAARAMASSGADLLKLQFPGDLAACDRVTAAAGAVPWALLGGADVDGDGFAEQLRMAVAAGACGFIAGRPIWGGAVSRPADEQRAWLRGHALTTFERLAEIADTHHRRSLR